MKIQSKIALIFDRVLNILAFAAGTILILAMLSVIIGVVARYCFERPQIWVIECTEYSLLFVTFLGTAWLLREEGHIKVESVLARLNPKTQRIINIVTSATCAIIFFIITLYGVKTTWTYVKLNYHLPTILAPPQYIIIAIIPLGSSLLLIQFLRRTYKYLISQKTPLDKEQVQAVKRKT